MHFLLIMENTFEYEQSIKIMNGSNNLSANNTFLFSLATIGRGEGRTSSIVLLLFLHGESWSQISCHTIQ